MAQNLGQNSSDRDPGLKSEGLSTRAKRESDRQAQGGDDKPFPVIRKPVPISESGPLRPKKPRSAKKQPPILTTRVADSQGQNQRDDHSKSPSANKSDLDSELDFLDLDDSAPWLSEPAKSSPVVGPTDERSAKSRFRSLFAGLALLLIVAGAASFLKPQLFDDLPVAWLDGLFQGSSDTIDQDAALSQTSTQDAGTDSDDNAVAAAPPVIPRFDTADGVESSAQAVEEDGPPRFVSPLSNRFRERLATLENLIESGSLDEAEQVLLDMDRRVYGYGAPEFQAIEERIVQLRSGLEAESAERLAQERAAAEALAAQQEAERLAVERAATEALIAQRQAAERLAEERAVTEAPVVQQEDARQAAQQATEIETASIESTGETDDFFVSSQDRNESQIAETEIELSQTISDDDLQLVYARFDQLQNAIRDRDIQAVISLTDRSVVKIQQFLQMFQNNVSIDARIKNVSTSNAQGEIQGTLVITRLERADGVVTGPPPDLASVTLTSKRSENGWSVIKW